MQARVPIFIALLLQGMSSPLQAEELRRFFPGDGSLLPGLVMQTYDTYDAETLWERINGEAELHRSYGLIKAAYALYGEGSDLDRTVQIALFELPDPLSAFGLYASYRPPGGKRRAVGNGAVTEDFQAFFWHGPYFAALESFGPPDFTEPVLAGSLDALAAAFGDAPPVPEGITALAQFVPLETIMYRPAHLLGREALPPGLEGTAPSGETWFLATEEVDIERTLAAYGTVIGEVSIARDHDGALLRGRDPVRGGVTILFRGTRMAGMLHGDNRRPAGPGLDALVRALGPSP